MKENLLPKTSSQNKKVEVDHKNHNTLKIIFKTQYDIIKEAIPALCCFEMQLLTLSLINFYFIGQLNRQDLIIALGIGDGLSKIVGYTVIKYLHMGLLSQCSQAYGYSKEQKTLIGVYYQRGLFISSLMCIILTPLFYLSDKILILIGIEKEVAIVASDYIWVCLPSFYAFTFYDATKSYLQSQNLFAAPMYMQLCQVIFQFFLSQYLISTLGFELIGAAWAKNLSDAFICILIYIYCCRKEKIQETWIEWNQSAFNRLTSYIKYSTTMGLAGYIQEFTFYILLIFSSHFNSNTDTATHIALSNSQQWHYHFFLGFHIVMINYLAEKLMAGMYNKGKHIVQQGVFLTVLSSFVWICLILALQTQWANLFTNIDEITEQLKSAIYIYCTILFFDAIQLTYCGILKGVDKQNLIIKVYIFAYLIVGLSVSYTLAFQYNMTIIGLYIGWLVGGIISAFSFIIIFLKYADWKVQYKAIQKRMLKEKYAVKKEQEILLKSMVN